MAVRPASDDSIGSSPLASWRPDAPPAEAAVPDRDEGGRTAAADQADTVEISRESRRRLELAQTASQERGRALSNAIPTGPTSRSGDALPVFEDPGPPDRRPRDPEETPNSRTERSRDASIAADRRREIQQREDVRSQNRPPAVREGDDDTRQAERRREQAEDQRRDRAARSE